MKFFISYLLILLTLLSCSDNPRVTFNSITKNNNHQTSLFNLSNMFSENENMLSFPIWFNDSIVKKNQISSIHRKIFYFGALNNNICCDSILKEEKKYSFYKDGILAGLIINNYYDLQKISTYNIEYENKRDQFGYQSASLTSHLFKMNTDKFNDDKYAYKLCNPIVSSNTIYAYKIQNENKHIYIIDNPLLHGALKVDSLVKPNPQDAIILGNTFYPLKKYKVKNLLKEIESHTYEYSKDNPKQILTIIRKKYPFLSKRDFIYSDNGFVNQYIDSIFSDQLFVSRTVSSIKYNESILPIRVTHRKENQMGDTLVNSFETFDYTFNNFQ